MLGASVANAACPVSSDAKTGIKIEYADSYSIHTRDADGSVTETEYSGDEINQYIAGNGLLETAFVVAADDVADQFSYTFDTSALVPPKPWSGNRGEQITYDGQGEEVDRVEYSYHTRGFKPYRIGPCTYSSIAFQTYQHFPDGKSMVEFVYLLDLGIPVPVGFGGDGYFDSFRPLQISVMGAQ